MQLREYGRPAEAYQLAASVRPSKAEDLVDEQFVAGFIALRSLGRPDVALQHFNAMAIASASLRGNLRAEASSQAGYFMGRALVAQGKTADAAKLFTAAATYRDTFYGLLSAGQVGAKDNSAQLAALAPNYPRLDVKYYDPRMSPELINAIIKPESNFKVTAVSPVGALGLMQLMPGTAAATARRAGVAVDMRLVATNAAVNVAIGSRLFGDLLTQYSNNVMLASAAYNAGSRPVDQWMARFGDPRGAAAIDPVDWVELIPFKETRSYVKRVVASYVTYMTLARR
jgi:soluble lytic murein transglycosylase